MFSEWQSLNPFYLHVRIFPRAWLIFITYLTVRTVHFVKCIKWIQLSVAIMSYFYLHSMVKTIELRFSVSASQWLGSLCLQQLCLNSNSCLCGCTVQQPPSWEAELPFLGHCWTHSTWEPEGWQMIIGKFRIEPKVRREVQT